VCVSFKFVEHGGLRGNTAQALARWRHLVASNEALAVLHWAMCPVLYRRICIAIEIARNLPAFVVAIDSLLPTTIAK
jgi:hypothetical protein